MINFKTLALVSTFFFSSAIAQTVTSVPAGYSPCANDYKTCSVNGTWDGYYGANGVFVKISGSNSFTCLPANLGVADPVPGKAKTCYVKATSGTTSTTSPTTPSALVSSVPAGYNSCATDGKTCSVSGNWDGYYGTNGKFAKISGSNSFTCLPNNLGVADPVPGVQKTCYVKSATSTTTSSTGNASVPAGYNPCAVDGQVCNVNGNWDGYYGANGTFVKISGSTPFTCLPNRLGVADPVPGVKKTCYVKTSTASGSATPAKVSAVPAGYKACTVDGQKCAVTGAWHGFYGAKNSFVEISGNNGFVCLPSNLRVTDPLPGVQKTCYINQSATVAEPPANCRVVTQNGAQYSRYKADESSCGCYCAANTGTACYYQSKRLTSFACKPGQTP